MKRIVAMTIVALSLSGGVFAGDALNQLKAGTEDGKVTVAVTPEPATAPTPTAKTQLAATPLKCAKEALDIAKMALNSKGKAYGFRESFIVVLEESLKQEGVSSNGKLKFSVGGEIGKGEYDIVIKVEDELCSLESVVIKDIGVK
jgi:hypothetical protein